MTLVQHALFRCEYQLIPKAEGCHTNGARKTVVADSLEEALARVTEHEKLACPDTTVKFGTITRESIAVWS